MDKDIKSETVEVIIMLTSFRSGDKVAMLIIENNDDFDLRLTLKPSAIVRKILSEFVIQDFHIIISPDRCI